MLGPMRRMPVGMPRLAVVVVVVMPSLVPRGGVDVRYDQLRAILRRFTVPPPLRARSLVEFLPRLPVVPVQAGAGL